jgi:polar amino acid transport system substrate-binding protein
VFIHRKIITSLTLTAALSALSLPVLAQDRNDPLFQAGAREIGASGEDQELKKQGLDALARSKQTGKLTACADGSTYPYSTSDGEPPGFDVEILRAIAAKAGLKPHLFWTDTGTRGGLGKALRSSIDKGNCDIFMGLAYGDDEELKDHKLALTKPYMGMGYVLVVQGKAAAIKSLEDARKNKIKIGVSMSTPLDDYLFTNGFDRSVYLQNRRIMEAMNKDEIDAGMVWSTAVGEARKEFPKAKFKLAEGFVPKEGLRFNAAWAVKAKEATLKQFIEESIDAMLKSGEIKKIVEGYGVPFYQPFP